MVELLVYYWRAQPAYCDHECDVCIRLNRLPFGKMSEPSENAMIIHLLFCTTYY